jgi:ElaB/YqjD/DUF883 family membrane-anchored ribosome-binding protein
MNTESAQNSQADGVSAKDIKEELSAMKDSYAQLLKDHAELAAMVAQLTSDKIDESDNEALKNAKDNIEKIRDKLNDIHSRVSSTVNSRKEDVERLKDHIERNPLTTVIAAFGLGYLIARILGLGGRR